MPTSTCVSKTHQEYWCLTHYSVTHKKFAADKWCAPCRERFKDDIEAGRIVSVSPKRTRKKSGS